MSVLRHCLVILDKKMKSVIRPVPAVRIHICEDSDHEITQDFGPKRGRNDDVSTLF